MNSAELEKRYRNRVRFWYQRFEALSDIIDKLQTTLEAQRKLIEKIVNENTQLVIELRDLQQQKEEMSFDNVVLEQ